MRFLLSMAVTVLILGALAGCGPKKSEEASTAPTVNTPQTGTATPAVVAGSPLGSIKVGDKAVCVVCAVNEGTTEPEEVKETLDYQGKTYAFCNLDEKAEFISNPSKYTGGSR